MADAGRDHPDPDLARTRVIEVQLLRVEGEARAAEDRAGDRAGERVEKADVALRQGRADALKLYGVEVLLPADMEKKYGKSPQRLSAWNTRAPNTYFAVGNLSGHAAVLMLRQAGAAWQVVGFHD